jgi:hypothetical protein
MGLTPPSQAASFLSVLLAVLALLVRYAQLAIPFVSGHGFETLLVAFLLLLAGNFSADFRKHELKGPQRLIENVPRGEDHSVRIYRYSRDGQLLALCRH